MEAVQWPNSEAENGLKAYLHYELQMAQQARQPLERQWRAWLEQYTAPAKQALKDFPFLGAANWELPITATDVDQFYAKFMQSIHASPDLWIVQPMNERWQDAAKPLQDFLSTLDKSVLKMYRVNKRAVMEMVKLGTAIYEHGWLYENRQVNTYDPEGNIIRANRIRSQPFVDHIRLVDFLIPPYAYAIQPDEQGGAPWVAKRVEMTREQMLAYAKSTEPMLPNIGMQAALDILAFENTQQDLYDDTIQRLTYEPRAREQTDRSFDKSSDATDGQSIGGGVGNYQRKIKLWECHVRWAVSGDSPSDLVVLFHEPTRTILRAIYQPYLHGQRPFEVIRFFPTEGFYGIGVCQQDEVFQRIGSELQNYLMDNVMLGNAQMIVAKEGANVAPGEPIYPGKVWIAQDAADIKPFTMGFGAYPGLERMIGLNDSQHNRRSGLSDLQVGNIDGLPGRTPATSVQALLAEGNRRPDLTIKDMRYEGLSIIGLRILQLIQQFANPKAVDLGGKKYLSMALETLGEPEGQYAVQKLITPMENVELGLGVEIAAASANANKDLQRQELTGLLTLYGQMAPQMIQMAQVGMQGQGTPIGAIAEKTLEGFSELLERVLAQYDIRDTEAFVPDIPRIIANAQAQQAALGPLAGAGQAGGGTQPAPGMAPVPAGG